MAPENKKINKKLIIALTVICTLLIIWIMVFKCNYNDGLFMENNKAMTIIERLQYKMVPFEKFAMALEEGGTIAKLEILSQVFNIICFIPFGMLLRFYTKKNWLILLISALFSLSIEVFQLFSCWGGPDYIDIISNTLGAAIGIPIYIFLRARIKEETIDKLALGFTIAFIPLTIFAIINSIINFPGF